ncbi:MAG: lipid-A-disaccharide synthase [Acidobacteriales bacterium]|nr:lipid-A-disaccharide synthase [Terriglobales bacterium]
MSRRRILISAGEASGEAYGAQLIEALRRSSPTSAFEFFGMGGEKMRAAGFDPVIDSKDVAIVGLAEVVKHLPGIYGEFRRLVREVSKRKPDAAVLIDFPDFNFRLAHELHRLGIPVIYFVSPQLWAWRKSRIKLVQKYVKRMLVIFPFEQEFYRKHGVDAEYVGHPLADMETPTVDRQAYAAKHGLDIGKTWIAMLPGSRKQEVALHLPEMCRALGILGPGSQFLLPVASTLERSWIEEAVVKLSGAHGPRPALVNDARTALAHSRAGVVASGTATVEAALVGTPFLVVYKVASLTWTLGRRLVDLPHYAMPNLIAGRTIVPELIQDRFTAENVVAELRKILPDGPARTRMEADLAEVRERLKPGTAPAAERAAEAVLRVL